MLDTQCPLCFEAFNATVCPVSLPCGHVFCENDIGQLATPWKCPTCRRPFDPRLSGTIRRLFLQYELKPDNFRLSSKQQEEALVLSAQMKSMLISQRARDKEDVEELLSRARTWLQSLSHLSEIEPKTAIQQLSISMDMLSLRLLENRITEPQSPTSAKFSSAGYDKSFFSPTNERIPENEVSCLRRDLYEHHQMLNMAQRELREAQRLLSDAKMKQREDRNANLRNTLALTNQMAAITSITSSEARSREFENVSSGARKVYWKTGARSPGSRRFYAVARWSSSSCKEEPANLGFRKGDGITLVTKTRGHWWIGMDANGVIGFVPDDTIQIHAVQSASGYFKASAIKPYNPSSHMTEDLSFARGEVIHIISKPFGRWWVGYRNLEDSLGLVSEDFIKLKEMQSRSPT